MCISSKVRVTSSALDLTRQGTVRSDSPDAESKREYPGEQGYCCHFFNG